MIVTKVYLASRSPRRRELLRQIGIGFEPLLLRERAPRGADVDETPLPGEGPDAYVRRVCRHKAEAAQIRVSERKLPRYPVLAADTVVCLGDEIFGKPRDRDEAAAMISRLSGREHRVLTAVAVQFGSRAELEVSVSLVRFAALAPADIAAYVASGEPMDKAGAYAVQGRAAAFIAEIRGSYSGIMGLPLFETALLLRRVSQTANP